MNRCIPIYVFILSPFYTSTLVVAGERSFQIRTYYFAGRSQRRLWVFGVSHSGYIKVFLFLFLFLFPNKRAFRLHTTKAHLLAVVKVAMTSPPRSRRPDTRNLDRKPLRREYGLALDISRGELVAAVLSMALLERTAMPEGSEPELDTFVGQHGPTHAIPHRGLVATILTATPEQASSFVISDSVSEAQRRKNDYVEPRPRPVNAIPTSQPVLAACPPGTDTEFEEVLRRYAPNSPPAHPVAAMPIPRPIVVPRPIAAGPQRSPSPDSFEGDRRQQDWGKLRARLASPYPRPVFESRPLDAVPFMATPERSPSPDGFEADRRRQDRGIPIATAAVPIKHRRRLASPSPSPFGSPDYSSWTHFPTTVEEAQNASSRRRFVDPAAPLTQRALKVGLNKAEDMVGGVIFGVWSKAKELWEAGRIEEERLAMCKGESRATAMTARNHTARGRGESSSSADILKSEEAKYEMSDDMFYARYGHQIRDRPWPMGTAPPVAMPIPQRPAVEIQQSPQSRGRDRSRAPEPRRRRALPGTGAGLIEVSDESDSPSPSESADEESDSDAKYDVPGGVTWPPPLSKSRTALFFKNFGVAQNKVDKKTKEWLSQTESSGHFFQPTAKVAKTLSELEDEMEVKKRRERAKRRHNAARKPVGAEFFEQRRSKTEKEKEKKRARTAEVIETRPRRRSLQISMRGRSRERRGRPEERQDTPAERAPTPPYRLRKPPAHPFKQESVSSVFKKESASRAPTLYSEAEMSDEYLSAMEEQDEESDSDDPAQIALPASLSLYTELW